MIDPLEQRQLLSVTADVHTILVSDPYSQQYTGEVDTRGSLAGGQSIATDYDGDTVVVWTATDSVLDPDRGTYISDQNIYGIYLTQSVQQVALTAGTASFSLVYGGAEIQQISITATNPPVGQTAENISGTFTLRFGTQTTALINYNESFFNTGVALDPAIQIQNALRALGGALSDVVVKGIDPHTYHVIFADSQIGIDQPQLTVTDPAQPAPAFTTGYLPAVLVTTVSEPVTIGTIRVHPTDPSQTIAAIESYFKGRTTDVDVTAPVGSVPLDDTLPAYNPISTETWVDVTVTSVKTATDPNGLYTFNIQFNGDAGKEIVPRLVVTNARDAANNPIANGTVNIVKQSSQIFRVNPEEPDNPYTFGLDLYNQYNPAVAMDAAGNFVITWESQVPSWVNAGSVTDIYARRFTPVGWLNPTDAEYANIWVVDMNGDGVVDTPIQGVRPLAVPSVANLTRIDQYTFRVNTLTANAQGMPSIAINAVGDFVISWSSYAQYSSFFNSVYMRKFTADGKPVDVEFLANVEDANAHVNSYVALSNTGRVGLVWESYAPMIQTGGVEVPWIDAAVYDAAGNRIAAYNNIASPAHQGSIAFDLADYFVICWQQRPDTDSMYTGPAGGPYTIDQAGVYAQLYNASGAIVQSRFRANSATLDPTQPTAWAGRQWNPQVAIDADGDITIVYEGYAPDVSAYSFMALSYIQEMLLRPENADLLPYINTAAMAALLYSNYQVEGEIEAAMFSVSAQMQGPVVATTLGGVNSILPLDISPTISSSATLIMLGNVPGMDPFPTTTPFSVLIDDEEIEVTSAIDYTSQASMISGLLGVSIPPGTQLYLCTVNRAQNGTSAAAHTQGSVVRQKPAVPIPTSVIENCVARIRAILDSAYGLLRGDANGVMFSQFDAQPTYGVTNSITTDAVINQFRDGENQRSIIILDEDITTGNFVIRVHNPYDGTVYEDIAITPVIDYIGPDANGDPQWQINITNTVKAINDRLETAVRELGRSWAVGITDLTGVAGGPLHVRHITADEINLRAGTDWELTGVNPITQVVFELTFQGEVHDISVSIVLAPNGNNLFRAPVPEVQVVTFSGATAGWCAVKLGETNSDDFWFDPADPTGTAAALQNAIQKIAPENSALTGLNPKVPKNVVVEVIDANNFRVTFHGTTSGIDQGPITKGEVKYKPAEGAPDLTYVGNIYSVENTRGETPKANAPQTPTIMEANEGTRQHSVSIAMQPNGTFITAWTQNDEYSDGSLANQSIYVRTVQEYSDTAGPMIAGITSTTMTFLAKDVGIADTSITVKSAVGFPTSGGFTIVINGEQMTVTGVGGTDNTVWTVVRNPLTAQAHSKDSAVFTEGVTLTKDVQVRTANGLQYLVVNFTEDMYYAPDVATQRQIWESTHPGQTPDAKLLEDFQKNWDNSVINPANYELLAGGNPLNGAIADVQYGLNAAYYLGLSSLPTNKYQAVLTLDGNGLEAGTPPIGSGTYSLRAFKPGVSSAGLSGLRDRAGNALGRTGYQPAGEDYFQTFTIVAQSQGDNSVDPSVPGGPGSSVGIDGRTYPQTPGAVAVDADGDHIVVWTAKDPISNRDRVYVALYDANGAPYGNPFTVTSTAAVEQRYATVACDADGDFVVTWTQYDSPDDANIYARRFNSTGQALGEAFRVNAYTSSDQIWSNVAMNTSGAFVITWSSLGQEDNGQMGSGYGVYARRYDAEGRPLDNEFRVNVTTAGNQQNSSVAMANDGGFVVVWQSNQNGIDDDIIARSFNPDGSPQEGPLGGELKVNTTTNGDQRYPDVAMNLGGESFVVTWQSAGQGGIGWDVYSRVINRVVRPFDTQTSTHYTYDGRLIPDPGALESYLTITDSILIRDLNVALDIITPYPRDLRVLLIGPDGTSVVLFDRVPKPKKDGSIPGGEDFRGTKFDDAAKVSINDSEQGAVPPFSNVYAPEQSLLAFVGKNAGGTWTLRIEDLNNNPGVPSQFLVKWSLEILKDPAGAPEVLVNTTLQGDQMYPSVAMAYDGSYVVTWSGYGNQPNQSDDRGVYYQRFNAGNTKIGTETRANFATPGNQSVPSIGSDAQGNVVIVWTGQPAPGGTAVYKLTGRAYGQVTDLLGPLVTDVSYIDPTTTQAKPLKAGSVIQPASPGVQQIVVTFSEKLSIEGGDIGEHSVVNPYNWILYRNGNELVDGIAHISFNRNPATRKWEATVTLAAPLAAGNYTLVVKDHVWDMASNFNRDDGKFYGNALDGDYDAQPATNPAFSSQPGYQISFTVVSEPRYGAEYRVNENPQYEQSLGTTVGIGFGRELSTRSVAVDHDGDFAVVWTSFGQDDPTAPQGAGVYLRLYDRNNNPLTPEILVNTRVAGEQRNATVAMDADGDLVVIWESRGQDPDGSWGIYGQRFDSMGRRLGTEFRVNTQYTNDQLSPAVAMDSFGNFIVVWVTTGQPFSYFNDIHGQRFDFDGRAVGDEFCVNSQNIPGTNLVPSSNEIKPAIALNDAGDFVVSWTQNVVQTNGVVTDSLVMARMFDKNGLPKGLEFQVNVGDDSFVSDTSHNPKESANTQGGSDIRSTARNSQVMMNSRGDFIVVWEAFQDNDLDGNPGPESYGIYFRRFSADGTPEMPSDHQANLVVTDTRDEDERQNASEDQNAPYRRFALAQVNPSIAMDADGDYVIVWEGNGAQPHPLDPRNALLQSDMDTQGIWIRSFHAQDLEQVNEAVTVQSRVNSTASGSQKFPSVAMTPKGDVIVVWSGNGVGDQHGIFFRRYVEPTDTAGPTIAEVRANGSRVDKTHPVSVGTQYLVVVFSEEMMNFGEDGVTNRANWKVLRDDGTEIIGAISSVSPCTLNTKTNKWEAVITFSQPLAEGNYTITARNAVNSSSTTVGQTGLRDKAGNPLNKTGYNQNGTGWSLKFSAKIGVGTPAPGNIDTPINATQTGIDNAPVVATAPNGDYVVVWVRYGSNGDAANQGNIVAQRFNANDVALGPEFVVNSILTGSQTDPDVAMDKDGNFVIVWTGVGPTIDDNGIFARAFDSKGRPQGDQFRVSTRETNVNSQPSVAVHENGNFVVTFTRFNNVGNMYGNIYGRVYNAFGQLIGNEFLVSSLGDRSNEWSDVAVDQAGNIVVVWQSCLGTNGNDLDIHAQLLSPTGVKLVPEFRVNNYNLNLQSNAKVSMANDGRFVVVWQSFGQDGNGWGVYHRRYNAAGVALDANERLVNTTTLDRQWNPDVSVDPISGDYTIVWTSFGHDDPITKDDGIFARMYLANGSDYLDPATGIPVGQFRINATTRGNQVTPAVSRNLTTGAGTNSDYVVVWVGPDSDGTGIFSRRLDPPEDEPIIVKPNYGPTISGIVTPATVNDTLLTWSATDPDGIGGVALWIDGKKVSTIYGPLGRSITTANYGGAVGNLAAGEHNYVIHVTDAAGGPLSVLASTFTVAAPVVPANSGPTVSNVVTPATTADTILTWSAADTDGIAGMALWVDGKKVGTIYGPMGAAIKSGNYAGAVGSLAAGNHTYVIHVTDAAGALTVQSGSFVTTAPVAPVVPEAPANNGPTIANVVAPATSADTVLTWSAADTDGIAGMALWVDGKSVGTIYGPKGAAIKSGNYAGAVGSLAAGDHTYVIHATDAAGKLTVQVGSFTTTAPAAPLVQPPAGPVISNVVAAESAGNGDGIIQVGEQIVVTWSLTDPDGIFSTSATLNGLAAKAVYGPYGSNYAAVFNAINTAGDYNFVIQARDNSPARNLSQYNGTLNVAQLAAVFAQVGESNGSAKSEWLINIG